MDVSAFLHKKTIGVPNVYLLGAVAVGIGIYAYKLKATPTPPATDSTAADPSTVGGATGVDFSSLDGQTTEGLASTPTDTTVTTPTNTSNLPNASIPDNQTWVSKGIQWLVANNKATGTDAQQALTTYVSGANYTFAQESLVNLVITEQGPPPDPLPTLGQASPAPAQRQFTAFPGTHTVKGPNDNTWGKLALLYYGHDDYATQQFLQLHNTLGGVPSFTVGTQVNIPAYTTPKYFTATATLRTDEAIAAKNGITVAQLHTLNSGGPGGTTKLTFPVATGTRVRVG